MEVKIKRGNEMIEASIEMVDGVMVVSPKEVKFEPKDGDVSFHDGIIYIFKGVKPSSMLPGKSAIIHHCYYDGEILEVKEGVGCGYIDCSQRPATEEEKQKLFDKLKEEGYKFDFEKKELVKLKWKPKYKEPYFAPFFSNVDFLFSTCSHIYTEHFTDELTFKKTSVFNTEQECQEFCDRLNDVINSIKP